MKKRICKALLLGTLLPLAAAADKPGNDGQSADSGFFKSLVPADPATSPGARFGRADILDLMEREDPMADWMRSRTRAASRGQSPADPWVNRYLPGDSSTLSGMEWQSRGGVKGLIHDYNALGDKVKSRLFGRDLSRKLEIELDGSPEIKYKVEFD